MLEIKLLNLSSRLGVVPWRKATNLAERVPGWWGVAPTSLPFTNAVKGVACEQTSVPFRNAIKRSHLQKVVYT